MTRDLATQQRILEQIVGRLRQQITEYNERNCFLCDQVVPASWPHGPVCCTVSLGQGVFPEAFFTGGGHATICKTVPILVSPWVRMKLDRPPEAEVALVQEDRGLIARYEPAILRALLIDERDGQTLAWEPTGEDGKALLRSQLAPASVTAPRPDSETGEFLGLTIAFSTEFDWLL